MVEDIERRDEEKRIVMRWLQKCLMTWMKRRLKR
jgi:hypothetical protein